MTEVRVPRLLTIKQVAQLTGLQPWRLYELISRGEGPPTMRVGKTIRIPDDTLARWIGERSQRAGQER